MLDELQRSTVQGRQKVLVLTVFVEKFENYTLFSLVLNNYLEFCVAFNFMVAAL